MTKKKGKSEESGKAEDASKGIASNDANDTEDKRVVSAQKKSMYGWTHVAVAIMSLCFGVFTPPGLKFLNVRRDLVHLVRLPTEHSMPEEATRKVLPLRNCNHDSDDLAEFLADEPVPGQHTLCFTSDWKMTVFRTSLPDMQQAIEPYGPTTWNKLKRQLDKTLGLSNRQYPVQAWALFTKDGERIVDEEQEHVNEEQVLYMIQESGVVLLFEGGVWIWPGIKEGFIRHITLDYLPGHGRGVLEKQNATLVTLSLYPLVISVEGFLEDKECEYIQEQAAPRVQYSGVVLMDKDKGRPASDFRTSQSTFLGPEYKGLERVDKRTASLVRIPRSHQEHVQVLRYGLTEKYDAHHDYFDPQFYQNDPATLHSIENGRKNRLATVFWYLTDVAEGGETIFPRYNKMPPPRSMSDCSVGLKVKPQRGKVIIFYSMKPDGSTDELSLHGACPVVDGVKWAANKWVWNKPLGWYKS